MTAESVGRTALGVLRPGVMRRVVLSVTATIATGVALLLPTPAANAEWIVGTDGEDNLIGTAQTDTILARGGDDDVSAGAEADVVHGGPGNDFITLGSFGIASWARMESAYGGPGFDTIEGTGARDRINGGTGGDSFSGGHGDNVLTDGDGSDELLAGTGDDRVRLMGGADQAFGFTGDDVFIAFPDGRRDQIGCGPGRDRVSWASRPEMLLDRTTGCEIQHVGRISTQLVPRHVSAGL